LREQSHIDEALGACPSAICKRFGEGFDITVFWISRGRSAAAGTANGTLDAAATSAGAIDV
jgi:hypothetical protein